MVGMMGSALNRRTGILSSSKGSGSAADVDFISGGSLPLLHRSAMQGARGPFNPALFFGLEELDAGMRIKRNGGRLIAFDDLAKAHGYWTKYAEVRAARSSTSPARRYYSWRNIIVICRQHRLHTALLMSVFRVLGSGARGLFGAEGGRERMSAAYRAVVHASRNQLGRTVDL
jgi:hypothetical protein